MQLTFHKFCRLTDAIRRQTFRIGPRGTRPVEPNGGWGMSSVKRISFRPSRAVLAAFGLVVAMGVSPANAALFIDTTTNGLAITWVDRHCRRERCDFTRFRCLVLSTDFSGPASQKPPGLC